jgi:Putative Ig domain
VARAISRDSFSELKNYLGVYLQQGRPILDADWNENQDIVVAALRRLVRESLGDGSPNRGFAIDPAYSPPEEPTGTPEQKFAQQLNMLFGPVMFYLRVPGTLLEDFESPQGFALSHPQGQPPPPGQLRITRDRPYQGTGYLRLSGHLGPVEVKRTLPAPRDLSAHELATFRFRLNRKSPGTMKFFLEDDDGNRSVWPRDNPALAQDLWLPGFAAPLDLSFRIITERLPTAVQDAAYSATLFTFSGSTPMQWTVSAGGLPDGLEIQPLGTGEGSHIGLIRSVPRRHGSFTFTVKVTDGGGRTTERQFTLEVREAGPAGEPVRTHRGWLERLGRFETPTGTPADLTAIRGYGFELYQDGTNPLVWDLDDLRLGSEAEQKAAARNNFIIRGSGRAQVLNQLTLWNVLVAGGFVDSDPILVDRLSAELERLSGSRVEDAGRMYVGGLPCLQVEDVLYSDQADPDDVPLTPPPTGEIHKDTVYLDVWTEPVTYVQDPAIRDVALGGPDTATRRVVRHRVRVAQDGETPRGNGIGGGTLATEGSYTAAANRLYLVEVDTPGDIGGQATFRWSDESAATIQRVIEPVPEGSTEVVVEDAAALGKGDLVLLRAGLGSERHEVASVFANVLTLVSPTTSSFPLADRPMVQRWNAFQVPIPPDPADATVSRAIDLPDGVQVRFGGRDLRAGDYWTFTARYLAGDEVSGIDPVTRIERLDFRPASGVVHHYAPLAVLHRDGGAAEPDQIVRIEDRRRRVGNAGTASGTLPDTDLTGIGLSPLGGLRLPPGATDSRLLIFWSGDLFLDGPVGLPFPLDSTLALWVSLYGDEMTDPVAERHVGKLQDRIARVRLRRRQQAVDIPLQLLFAPDDTDFAFLPPSAVPTWLQMFVELDQADFRLELRGMRVTVIELKKSF